MKNIVNNKFQDAKPKLSIIMSAYNADKYIEESIRSILDQSYKNFEFIIVNDGSNDRTLEIIDSFGIADRRIKIINQENKGLTKTLIESVAISNGDYIARMDADDVSNINRLSTQINYLESNRSVGMLGTWINVIDSSNKVTKTVKLPSRSTTIKRRMQYGNQFVHGSVMFRKDIYEAVGGYDESFKFSQDYDLWLRMIKITDCINITKCLYYLRVHENSISITNNQLQLEHAVRCITKNIYGKKDLSNTDDQIINTVSARLLLRRGEYHKARAFYYKMRNIEGILMSNILKHTKITALVKRGYVAIRSLLDSNN